MKKIMAYLYVVILTAAGITMTACSDDNDVTEPEEKKTFTLTVEATNGNGDLTRALAEESDALKATWTEGEAVNVYEGETILGTLIAQSSAATTQLSGTIDAPSASGVTLTLKYQETNYTGQDGTLATIGAHHNYCTATTTVTKTGDNYIGTKANFVSQQAIVKFTLKKKSDSSVIKATTMNIYRNGNSFLNLSLTANDNGEYYIALPPIYNEVLRIEVTVGTTPYAIESPTTTFEAGKYYPRNVSFTYNYIYNFSGATGYTIGNGLHALCRGNQTGTTLTLEEGSTATLDNLNIQSTVEYWGIECNGNDTIILKDGTTNTITGNGVQALYVAEGKTLTITGTGTLTLVGGKDGKGSINLGESLKYSENTTNRVVITKK